MSCCTHRSTHEHVETGAQHPVSQHRVWMKRATTLGTWALPVAVLTLIPKCPACVAMYVLLFTGVGISFPAAAAARWVMVGVCIAAIATLSIRAGLAFLSGSRTGT